MDDVRRRKLEVLPYCPFIRGWIGRHPQYADLVPEVRRGRFGL
ncbi:N-acetyltransferase [Streptomyces sp. NPDC086989]